jgi:hypothetical protein
METILKKIQARGARVSTKKLGKKDIISSSGAILCMILATAASIPPGLQAQEHQIEKATIYKDIYPLITEADRYCSFFIWNGDMPDLHITGSEREYEREMLSNGDVVYLNQGRSHGLEAGQVFMALQMSNDRGYGEGMMQETVPGYGRLAYRRGRVRIQALGEDQATAEIEKACGKIMVGDYLIPFQPKKTVEGKDLGYDIPPFDIQEVGGEIVFLETEFNQIGSGQWALINLGEQDGVDRGDQFIIFRHVNKQSPPKVFGNSVVIDVQEETATIKILSCRDTVEIGDLIVPHPEK